MNLSMLTMKPTNSTKNFRKLYKFFFLPLVVQLKESAKQSNSSNDWIEAMKGNSFL